MTNRERDIIDRTIEVFQPRAATPLSREDGREMLSNVTGFFKVLSEWAARERVEAPSPAIQDGTTPVTDQRATARCASRTAKAGRSKRSARKALPDGMVPDLRGSLSPVVHAVNREVPKEDDEDGSRRREEEGLHR